MVSAMVIGGAGRAEGEAVVDGLLDCLAHGTVVVTDDHRTPRADVVDVAVAIDVEQIGTVGTLDEEGLAADRLEGAHRRVDAAGQQLLGA